MNERDARTAKRLRDEACAALAGGNMQAAQAAIEAFMVYDREEALRLKTSLGIETNDCEYAEAALKELERLAPEKAYTRYLAARVAYLRGEWASVIEPLEKLLKRDMSGPVRERVCNLLGRVYRRLGESEAAARCDLEASKAASDRELAADEYGNYLFDLHHIADRSVEEQYAAAAKFDTFFEDIPRFLHRREKDAKLLRVGYISADFRYHVVLRFAAAMLCGKGQAPFSVYAYMTGPEDSFSGALAQRVDVWRNLRGLSPQQAARMIYEDEIDILVELGGHTTGNALKIMAYKPAPVQVCGIGYWASTGLSAIDYFLGDVYLDDETAQNAFTETLLILPRTHFCYTEIGRMPSPAEEPPCVRTGTVTFGSFNDFSKASDEVLRLWARIMERVPQARLLLKGNVFKEAGNRAYALERMKRMGVPTERVEMRGFSLDYLEEYADMDVALDTFPYPGGGTTCDALFMGVPVVAMAGKDHGGRFGKSLLMNLGLGELAAETPEDYVEKAVAVSEDRELLCAFRKNLRDMMRRSPLMDGEQYRKDLAAAYTEIWRKYIQGQPENKASGDSFSE
jgi:predicted O-linked N-acetylglucosamine transferase (SPINDLY family)